MVKDHSDSERENPLSPFHELLFPIFFFFFKIDIQSNLV